MGLLRCLVGCTVWSLIFGVILGFAGLGVLLCYNAQVGVFASNNVGFLGLPAINNIQYYATYGYICFGISGFIFLMMFCCYNRIRFTIAVCKIAGQFVRSVCRIMLLPLILTIILIGMWGCCLLCMIYLLSSTYFYVANPTDIFTSVQDYG
jgi:hypothetical protein